MRRETIRCLKETAAKCRLNVVRMLRASGHGHIGGTYSSIDMVTALYFYKMNVNVRMYPEFLLENILFQLRLRTVPYSYVLLIKGTCPCPPNQASLDLHSKLAGHPNMHKLPGVEASTGALGHGLSIATGMAMGLRLDKKPSKVYTILGDGELAEGSNWEAAAAAAHYKLDNLTAIVDFNGLQISGKVTDVMVFTPIGDKFREFGWAVREIDGNNMDEIVEAFDALPFEEGKPSMIVAHTVKAKGLKEGEGKASYHYWNPSKEDCDALEKDLMEQLRGYEDEI